MHSLVRYGSGYAVSRRSGEVMLLEHHQRGSGELPLLDAPRGSVAASRPRSLGGRAAPTWVRTYSAALVVFEALAAAAAGAAVVFTRPGGLDTSSNLFWSALVLVIGWGGGPRCPPPP